MLSGKKYVQCHMGASGLSRYHSENYSCRKFAEGPGFDPQHFQEQKEGRDERREGGGREGKKDRGRKGEGPDGLLVLADSATQTSGRTALLPGEAWLGLRCRGRACRGDVRRALGISSRSLAFPTRPSGGGSSASSLGGCEGWGVPRRQS